MLVGRGGDDDEDMVQGVGTVTQSDGAGGSGQGGDVVGGIKSGESRLGRGGPSC